eukprot:gene486-492_t
MPPQAPAKAKFGKRPRAPRPTPINNGSRPARNATKATPSSARSEGDAQQMNEDLQAYVDIAHLCS